MDFFPYGGGESFKGLKVFLSLILSCVIVILLAFILYVVGYQLLCCLNYIYLDNLASAMAEVNCFLRLLCTLF